MKIKDLDIRKLKGVALDYAVAMAIGRDDIALSLDYKKEIKCFIHVGKLSQFLYSPTTRWYQCGDLIDFYKIDLGYDALEEKEPYFAIYFDEVMSGNSYQEAACRVVVWIHGDKELEIPNELLKE